MTPKEIRDKKFSRSLGFGYRIDDIESFLEDVSDDYEKLLAEKKELNEKIEILIEKINEYRNNEDGIKNAILGAQSLGNGMITRSKSEAQAITSEARHQAEVMMDNAKRQVEREEKELERVKKEADAFKGSLFEMYKVHLAAINNIPSLEKTLKSPKTEEALEAPKEEMIMDQQPNHENPQEVFQQQEDPLEFPLDDLEEFAQDHFQSNNLRDLFKDV